jgi:hypothetical protein
MTIIIIFLPTISKYEAFTRLRSCATRIKPFARKCLMFALRCLM